MLVFFIQAKLKRLVPLDFFFFFLNIKYFNMHMGRGKKVLKKLTVLYIPKGLVPLEI